MTCSFVLQHACCAENMLNFIMSACQQLSTGYVVTVRARADSATSSVRFSVGRILSSTCPSTERAVKTLSFGELRIRESSQTNLIWRIPITRRSWDTAEQLCFLRAKCARHYVYPWKSNTWCSWRKCGGTLHPSPTTWLTNTSAITCTVLKYETHP